MVQPSKCTVFCRFHRFIVYLLYHITSGNAVFSMNFGFRSGLYLEYLSCLGEGSIITYSALPVLLKKSWEQHRSDSSSYVTMDSAPQTTAFFRAAGIHAEEFLFLLGQLAEASKAMRGMGRGSLKASAQEAGVVLSDNEIRTALHCLSQLGLVKIGRGRRATRISASGLSLYRQLCPSSQPPA